MAAAIAVMPAKLKLLRQAPLVGARARGPFRTTAHLGRIGRDHLDAQLLHGAAKLGRVFLVDLAASLRRRLDLGHQLALLQAPLHPGVAALAHPQQPGRFVLRQPLCVLPCIRFLESHLPDLL